MSIFELRTGQARQPRESRETPVTEGTIHSLHLSLIRWAKWLAVFAAIEVGLLCVLIYLVGRLLRAMESLP